MRYLSALPLLSVAAVAAVLGWSVNRAATGTAPTLLILPWPSLLAEAAVGIVVIYLGLRVRAYRNPPQPGERRRGGRRRADPAQRKPYDPVWAVSTAAAAQAVAYYGALTAGWHAGLAVDQFALLTMRSTQQPLWWCLAQVLAGLALVVIGWIVEHSCRLPPDDPDAQGEGSYGNGTDPYTSGEGGYARHQ